MAKPTGFIEYERVLPPDRPPEERVKDWNEFHTAFKSQDDYKAQAARCMDCGTPFCHSGVIYDGAVSGCPINNLIPEWNDLIYRGLWREALNRLRLTNNFPEFTGRVCPAPCEGACTVGSIPIPSVSIKLDEVSIIDRGWEEGWLEPSLPAKRTGKKVAVVGSGPAGLACAAELNMAGHSVTVFERADRIGGLMMYGIPAMKLDKGIVDRRIKLLAEEGIELRVNVEVGKSFPTEKLRKEFDAIALCGGSTVPRDLPVEGRKLAGVHFAMEFLTANTKHLLDGSKAAAGLISAKDKHVIVIGGGDTGSDCVGTAIRQEAASVTQLEILPQPPEGYNPETPWPFWPKIMRLS